MNFLCAYAPFRQPPPPVTKCHSWHKPLERDVIIE